MDYGLLLVIFLVLLLFGGICLIFTAGIIYKLLDMKISKKTADLGGEGLYKALEQVNRARATEANQIKEKLADLEAKVELLAKPHSKEKEVEMEKIFAHSRKK